MAVENVTQLAGLCAVHAQPEPAVTAMVPVPEVEATEALEGEMLYPHPAACVMVTACPATVRTPERDCVVEFAATEYDTVPEPVPLAPLVIDIQDTALVAVHVQPAAVVTETLPVPPAVAALAVVGFTVWLQVTPACDTLSVCPAIVNVPLRAVVDVLAATLKVTAPPPEVFGPPPAVTVIHVALLVALH